MRANDSEMSLPVLAAHCLAEIDNYRRGEPGTERYGLELIRRALLKSDHDAWAWVQHCFEGMVHGWVRCHPQRAVACRLESEENYVAQAFERFWQATAYNQQLKFRSLAAALQYLRASVNGAILDTLRTYQRPGEVSLPESGAPGEASMEDMTCGSELWDNLKSLFSNPRERAWPTYSFTVAWVQGRLCMCFPGRSHLPGESAVKSSRRRFLNAYSTSMVKIHAYPRRERR
jgi:hypothetical protein